MSLQAHVRKHLTKMLEVVDEQGTRGPRLLDDAQRLWHRVQKFIAMGLAVQPDLQALELACYAVQLPMNQAKPPTWGKPGRTSLRERAEQAAELMVNLLQDHVEEDLLDRAVRLLHEMPHRSPMLEDARLLADAINLDDFGVTGLVMQMIELARQGEGIKQLAEGCEKREQYGYWEVRLKDGFHFERVREIARRRLSRARKVAAMLAEELKEDHP